MARSASPLRILLLTASMGEGHNTAARNVRDALLALAPGSEVQTADPYTRTNPVVNRLMQRGYTTAINNYPRAWKVVFEILSRRGVVEGMGPMLAELTTAVRDMIRDFQPDLIASTYPVFSFLMAKIRRKTPDVVVPFYTIITDSTQINSAWYRCPCDGSIVADEATAEVLAADGVPRERIHVLGFPVGLPFEEIHPMPAPENGVWKVVFFPGGTPQRAVETVRRLERVNGVSVTVITGKRTSTHKALQAAGLPCSGRLHGWVEDMPNIMASHHVFIGKAGGATVQEAIAAQIPFVVSHVVPGQEEGNIELIQRTGIGALGSASPQEPGHILEGAMANEGLVWKAWRKNLEKLRRPSAAKAIAAFLIERAEER